MTDIAKIFNGSREELKRLVKWAAEGSSPEIIICGKGNVTDKESGYYGLILMNPIYREYVPEHYRERVLEYMPKHVSECKECADIRICTRYVT